MSHSHALRYLFLAALLATPHLLEAQEPTRQVRAEALRRLRGTLPSGGALTVASSEGIDTVSARAPLELRAGDLLVAKRSEVAVVPEIVTAAPAGGPDSAAVTRTAALPPAPMSGDDDSTSVVRLPYTLGTVDPAMGAGVRYLEARVEIVGGGFRYDPTTQSYVGRVLIGIVDRDNPGRQLDLSNVFIQVGGEVDRANPNTLALRRTSVPFQEVALRAGEPRSDTVRLRLIPSFDPAGITVAVPVLVPTVKVQVTPVHIAGLGLEKTDVLIEPPFAGVVPMMVTALHAHPDPNRLEVGPTGTALVHVRSKGVRTDTILVTGGAYRARVEVVYDPPWLFAAAVLTGGVLGGLLNGFSRRRRANGEALGRLAMQGALTGLGVAVLYAVGIRVFHWAPDGEFGEALIFALSFMGGLAGPRAFDALLPSRRRRGAGPGEPKPARVD